jgi:hypothetical protein
MESASGELAVPSRTMAWCSPLDRAGGRIDAGLSGERMLWETARSVCREPVQDLHRMT